VLKPTFIAHRGYAASFPENTLIALEAAREAGAEYIEVDVQLSKDLVPVLFHDRDLQRLCQQQGVIHDYTFAELKTFNVTDVEKFSDIYVDNKITSLQEFLDYLKVNSNLNAFIELKRLMIDSFGEKKVLEILLPMFSGMEQQICFISYNQSILKTIHDSSQFATGIVVDKWSEYNTDTGWQSEWLFCSVEGLPENNKALAIKPKLAVFEVGNIGLAQHLLAKGIGHLETFRIKEMMQAFYKGGSGTKT